MPKFEPQGPLMLDKASYGLDFLVALCPEPFKMAGDIAVIESVGPFDHHRPDWQSFDALKDRFAKALASPAKSILLSIDSPGGVLAGCLDTSAEIVAMCREAGKPFYAYVDATCASAAYALIAGADRIYCPPSGTAGSIGVFEVLVDLTKADAAMGVGFTFVTSGAHKALGAAHTAITEATLADSQKRVNTYAELFVNYVSQVRNVPAESLRALEGLVLIGAEALSAGLVDEICGFDETLKRIQGMVPDNAAVAAIPVEEQSMSLLNDAAVKLQAVIDDESSSDEDKECAKRMLAEMQPEETTEEKAEDTSEPDGDEEPAKEDPKAFSPKAVSAMVDKAVAQALANQKPAKINATAAARAELTGRGKPTVGYAEAAKASSTLPGTLYNAEQAKLLRQAGILPSTQSPVTHNGCSTSIRIMTQDEARALLAQTKKESV